VRYNLTPQWGLGAEYRFLNGFHPGPFRAAVGGGSFNTSDYRNHSILLSVTYSFGAPPPPAPMMTPAAAPAPTPAPAPAPSAGARQLFIVFFDFDKSTITEAGRKVLDAAAAAVKSNQSVRIDVTGYTDTVGTSQYNLGLSNRRADAVRDYLSRHGIGADHMNVVGKGKTDLRVQTPDGVREPQNRRVEIVIP
jgi:outer membrane protein OmpA-like peptidoglycan-associated protein